METIELCPVKRPLKIWHYILSITVAVAGCVAISIGSGDIRKHEVLYLLCTAIWVLVTFLSVLLAISAVIRILFNRFINHQDRTSKTGFWDVFDRVPPIVAASFFELPLIALADSAFLGYIFACLPGLVDKKATQIGNWGTFYGSIAAILTSVPLYVGVLASASDPDHYAVISTTPDGSDNGRVAIALDARLQSLIDECSDDEILNQITLANTSNITSTSDLKLRYSVINAKYLTWLYVLTFIAATITGCFLSWNWWQVLVSAAFVTFLGGPTGTWGYLAMASRDRLGAHRRYVLAKRLFLKSQEKNTNISGTEDDSTQAATLRGESEQSGSILDYEGVSGQGSSRGRAIWFLQAGVAGLIGGLVARRM